MRPLVPLLVVFCLTFLPAAVKCAPTEEDEDEDVEMILPLEAMETPPIPEELQKIMDEEMLSEIEDGTIADPEDTPEDRKKRSAGQGTCQDHPRFQCSCRIWASLGYCNHARFTKFMPKYCNGTCHESCKAEASCGDVRPSTRYCSVMKRLGYHASSPLAKLCCPETYDLCPAENGGGGDGELSEFEQACLDNHNAKRKLHDTAPMGWCPVCAQKATQYAKELKAAYDAGKSHPLKHSTQSYRTWVVDGKNVVHGENLYWTWSDAPSCAGSSKFTNCVESWYEELKWYERFRGPTGRRPISRIGIKYYGHLTQMLWKESLSVGCGRSGDTRNNILACLYEVGGNKFSTRLFNKNVNVNFD